MTILGKILVFFVLFLSLVWTGLTVNAFATRTNYKAALDDATGKIKVAVDGAVAQEKYARDQKTATDVVLQQKDETIRNLSAQVKNLTDQNAKSNAALTDKTAAQQNDDDKVRQLQTERDKLVNQVKLLQDNQAALEKQVNDSLIAAQKAKDSQLQAELGRAAAEKAKDDAEVRLGKLTNRAGALAGVPTVPEGFRATVVSVSGDQVAISLGVNAGLLAGSTLDISRTVPEAKYVGQLLITRSDAFSAVGRFIPRAGVRNPSGDDLPKAGDTVGLIRN